MTQAFFSASKAFRGDLAATAKGLVFVQLYAAYEYAVRAAVETAIDSINLHQTRMRDIRPQLLALYLDPLLTSLRDSGRDRVWEKRVEIFEQAFSANLANLSQETRPPSDGSHYRHTQLLMILRVFGITRKPVRRRRHLYRIDEVVNNRNQIAHGSEKAEDVGRRYTRDEVNHIISQMRSVSLLWLTIFDTYCSDAANHRH